MEQTKGFKDNKYYRKIVDSTPYRALVRFLNRGNVRFVLFLYLISFFLFGITLINNSFTIPVNGDFVLQEIPFYFNGFDDWWSYLTSGKFVLWDENTNLGVNNIGSNSFYYLLDVFFLPTLLVPRSLVPQMQAFLIMSKMVLSGYIMKKLLELFKVRIETAEMIGVAYAFSGWSLYYLWFNHFLEITILLPLVMYGIEVLLRTRKPAKLILSLFLSAMTNYFFFIMICFCTVMYAVFRYFQLWSGYSKKERGEIIGLGIAAYAVGIVLSLIVLLPAFSVALNSSRASSSSYTEVVKDSVRAVFTALKNGEIAMALHNVKALISNLFYFTRGSSSSTSIISNIARVYLYPLVSFFYPTVSCNDHIIINNTGYDNALSSLFLYTPVMLMMIPSVMQSFRQKRISHVVGTIGILVLIFTPFAYYCFSGFTNIAYGRWQLFPVVCMFLYAGISFDRRDKMKAWFLDISFLVCLGMEILLLYLCKKLQGTSSVQDMDVDATNVVYAQMAYLVILFAYMRWKFKNRELAGTLKWVIAIEAVVSCNLLLGFSINLGGDELYVGFFGTSSYDDLYGGRESLKSEQKLLEQIKKNDESYYRVYNTSLSRNSNNLGMVENYNGLGSFHSIYGYELNDFLQWTHFTYDCGNGSWSMGDHEKKINLENFLNVKYYIMNEDDSNVPFGLTKIFEENGKVVYRNDNYISLGFNFDSIVSADYVSGLMQSTYYNNYYLSGTYTGYVPKLEYLLTDRAILYEEDALRIIEQYPDLTYSEDIDFSAYFKGIIYTRTISNNEATIRAAKWDDGPGGSGAFLNEWDEYEGYTTSKATALKWNSELIVNLTSPLAPDASSRGGAYITLTERMGENLIITLYDREGNEICSDRHMTHYYDKSGDKKYERGFYVDRPVYKIVITVKDTFKSTAVLAKPNATYQYYDSYIESIGKQKQSEFTNVTRDTNRYTFESSQTENKVSVLTIPYDTGWTLTRIDEEGNEKEIEIFKGQGGFISFINEKGNYRYRLDYLTPYLYEGCLGFIVGSMIFAGIYYSLHIVRDDKEFIELSTRGMIKN